MTSNLQPPTGFSPMPSNLQPPTFNGSPTSSNLQPPTSNGSPSPRICTHCILPETFPGLKFDEQGVCNHCRQEEPVIKRSREKKAAYREKLDALVWEVKGKGPNYDAIVAYSGGKDSSYTVKILKDHYDLRMIALTFDNHFVSPFTWDNIRNILDNLRVDQITFKPPWEVMRSTFSLTAREDIFAAPTLSRASSMCTACITIIKSLIMKTALEMHIPLVAFGWSPGQAPIQSAIMKTNQALIRQNQRTSRAAFPPSWQNSWRAIFSRKAIIRTIKIVFHLTFIP